MIYGHFSARNCFDLRAPTGDNTADKNDSLPSPLSGLSIASLPNSSFQAGRSLRRVSFTLEGICVLSSSAALIDLDRDV